MRFSLLMRLNQRITIGLPLLFLPVGWLASQTLQLPPATVERFQQASEAMRSGNLDAAGDGFAEVIKQAPTFAEAYLNLGLVREEQGKHAEAIGDFQKA